MTRIRFLQHYEGRVPNEVYDEGRKSHVDALIRAGIAVYEQPASRGDIFSVNTDGIVNGPTAGDVTNNYILQADNTWVDAASVGHTGTTGSVFFADAGGAGSAPTEDNDNFFWDDTAKELGVGINAPTATVHVKRTVSAEADHVLRVERNGGVDPALIFYVGDGGADADLLVRGDGHVCMGESQDVASAQLNVVTTDLICLRIDQNDTTSGQAIVVASDATTGDVVDITADSITTATLLDVNANGLTTGKLAFFGSNSSDGGSRDLVKVQNFNSSATAALPLVVEQFAAHDAFQVRRGLAASSALFNVDENGRVWVANQDTPAATAQLHVKQDDASAAIPVLHLEQLDVSEEMIQFETTIGTGNAIEAVGAKTLTTTHFIKVTLPGGLTRYIPAGTIA